MNLRIARQMSTVARFLKSPAIRGIMNRKRQLREKAGMPRSSERGPNLKVGDEWPHGFGADRRLPLADQRLPLAISPRRQLAFSIEEAPCSRQRTSLVRTGFFTDSLMDALPALEGILFFIPLEFCAGLSTHSHNLSIPQLFCLGFPLSDEDVRKIRVFGSTMPVLLTRRDKDDITRGHDSLFILGGYNTSSVSDY